MPTSRLERQRKAQLSCDDSEKWLLVVFLLSPIGKRTYPWQFGYHNSHESQKIDNEISQIVMRVVSTEKEKHNGYAEKELFGRRILVAVVDLLPHVQIVVCARVKLERHPSDPVEHEVGSEHVDDIGEGPRHLLRHPRHYVEKNLEAGDQDKVDGPGTYRFATMSVLSTWLKEEKKVERAR
jgi:hypothetical protein